MKNKILVFSMVILLTVSFLTVFPSVSAEENTPPTIKTKWLEVAGVYREGYVTTSLTVYNNNLYTGVYRDGRLFKWNDVNSWEVVAEMLGVEVVINSLAVYNGSLYGGTSYLGKLYKWNDVDSWIEVAGQFGVEEHIYSLAVYNGSLFGGTGYSGKLLKWNDVDSWIEVAGQLGVEQCIHSLIVYNNDLYGGTGTHGKLYKWNDVDSWIEVASQLGVEDHIYSLAVYDGSLYGGTSYHGKLYKWNDVDSWIEVAGQLGDEVIIGSLTVYNNNLYGGTYTHAKLYKWNDVDSWIEVAGQFGDSTSIDSLIVYNNDLYGGAGYLLKFSNDIYPNNNQRDIKIDTTLKIGVIDDDSDNMSVSFYWSDNTLIETVTDVISNTNAETSILSLDLYTSYNWYAVVSDSMDETQSDTFSFTTRESRIYHIDEDFSDSFLPTDWEEIVYSGYGHWEMSNDTYSLPSNSEIPYAMASSDTHTTLIFNVSLFTPKINLSSILNSLYLDCKVNFIRYQTDEGYIRVWSTNRTILEETLEHFESTNDINIIDELNITGYSNTNDIQIEFYYTTNNDVYQYLFAIDDVMVYEVVHEILIPSITPSINIYGYLSIMLIISFAVSVYILTRKKAKR